MADFGNRVVSTARRLAKRGKIVITKKGKAGYLYTPRFGRYASLGKGTVGLSLVEVGGGKFYATRRAKEVAIREQCRALAASSKYSYKTLRKAVDNLRWSGEGKEEPFYTSREILAEASAESKRVRRQDTRGAVTRMTALDLYDLAASEGYSYTKLEEALSALRWSGRRPPYTTKQILREAETGKIAKTLGGPVSSGIAGTLRAIVQAQDLEGQGIGGLFEDVLLHQVGGDAELAKALKQVAISRLQEEEDEEG